MTVFEPRTAKPDGWMAALRAMRAAEKLIYRFPMPAYAMREYREAQAAFNALDAK